MNIMPNQSQELSSHGNHLFLTPMPEGVVVLIPQSLQPTDVVRLHLEKEGDSMDLGRLVESRKPSMDKSAPNNENPSGFKPKVVVDLSRRIVMFRSKVISRNHCRIFRHNNWYKIQDTKSSSGTFVNGRRLSIIGEESMPIEIFDGDLLQLGEDYDQQGVVHECLRFKIIICPPDAKDRNIPETETGATYNNSLNAQIDSLIHPTPNLEYAPAWSLLVQSTPSTFLQPLLRDPGSCHPDNSFHILDSVNKHSNSVSANEINEDLQLSMKIRAMDWSKYSESDSTLNDLLMLVEQCDPRLEVLYSSLGTWDLDAFQKAAIQLLQIRDCV